MIRLVAALAVASALVAAPAAAAPFVLKTSEDDVATVIDRLERAVEAAGATVLARLDHRENAASVDMEMPPATVLIFGNPKLGTPMMRAAPSMAVSLPVKVAAYVGDDGVTKVIYRDMVDLGALHGATDMVPFERANAALDRLTEKAVTGD
jgi:uncharacterized protein (DUF302 family)